jgi:hypothetical protein
MTNMNNPAAGWYPDPQNPMSQRYWSGSAWTDQTRPNMPSSPVPPPHGGLPAGAMVGQRPDNYLMWSILSTICCCLPLGIPAIVNAAQVNGAWSRGDVAGAMRHSAQAKKFTIIAAAAGGVLNVLALAVQLFVLYAGS